MYHNHGPGASARGGQNSQFCTILLYAAVALALAALLARVTRYDVAPSWARTSQPSRFCAVTSAASHTHGRDAPQPRRAGAGGAAPSLSRTLLAPIWSILTVGRRVQNFPVRSGSAAPRPRPCGRNARWRWPGRDTMGSAVGPVTLMIDNSTT
jgi:hypothetical protein